MEDMLRRIRISAGIGENRFTMKRGSFNYRQKNKKRISFKLKEIRRIKNGYDMIYRRYRDEIILSVEKQDDFYKAHLKPNTLKYLL